MTQVKHTKIKSFQPMILQGFVVVCGLLAFWGIAQDRVGLVAGVLTFGGALLLSIWGSSRWMKSQKCPDCGGQLHAPRGWWYRFPGVPILFRCGTCDIDWDFGMRGQED